MHLAFPLISITNEPLLLVMWISHRHDGECNYGFCSKDFFACQNFWTCYIPNKEAITKAAEESIGYKKWKNRKWLRTWNEEIQQAIEENKASYRKYFQNKTVEHYIEHKRHRAIVRKMTRGPRREDWDKFVKTLERDITGTQRRGFKYLNSYNCKKEINSKSTL